MNWYLVNIKGGEEPRAALHLAQQAFEVFLPKTADGKSPLFPRYLFIRFDPETQSAARINNSRGVRKLVTFGDVLVPAPDKAIRLLQQPAPAASSSRELEPGGAVKVVSGTFAGIEAVFDEPDGEKRSFLIIEMLGKQLRVAVANSHLG